jgi:hypothetical protein
MNLPHLKGDNMKINRLKLNFLITSTISDNLLHFPNLPDPYERSLALSKVMNEKADKYDETGNTTILKEIAKEFNLVDPLTLIDEKLNRVLVISIVEGSEKIALYNDIKKAMNCDKLYIHDFKYFGYLSSSMMYRDLERVHSEETRSMLKEHLSDGINKQVLTDGFDTIYIDKYIVASKYGSFDNLLFTILPGINILYEVRDTPSKELILVSKQSYNLGGKK